MKNIIFVLLTIFIFSCKNNDTISGLPLLSIDKVKILIPSDYETSSRVIFKNIEDSEMVFRIETLSNVETKTINETEYQSEQFTVNLRNDDSQTMIMFITAGANYTSLENSIDYVNCGIAPSGNPGYRPTITIGSDREASFGLFEDEIDLLNKTFKNVYTNFISEDITTFSELYYTVDEGIIAFRDFQNNLWVLDRYE